jgi:serine/threonine-protein kinase
VGIVISSTPAAGETIENGSTVTLLVSAGPEEDKIEMPNFVGKNEGQVLKGLLNEKLFPGKVTYEASKIAADNTETADASVIVGNVFTAPASGGLFAIKASASGYAPWTTTVYVNPQA